MYTDEISLPLFEGPNVPLEDAKLWEFWMASNFFCLPALTLIVEHHMSTLINSENVCYIWNYVNKLEAKLLQEACKHYFSHNLNIIVSTAGFLSLDRQLLLDVFYTNQEEKRDLSGLATHFSA